MDTSTGLPSAAATDQSQRARDEIPSIVATGPWIAFAALAFGLGFDALHAVAMFKFVAPWCRPA